LFGARLFDDDSFQKEKPRRKPVVPDGIKRQGGSSPVYAYSVFHSNESYNPDAQEAIAPRQVVFL
jgi:hypothetical protein